MKSALGGIRRCAFDKNNERYELREVFDAYMRVGGMPGIADVGLEQEKAIFLFPLLGIYLFVRDCWRRGSEKERRALTRYRIM